MEATNLPDKIKKTIDEFVKLLKDAYGDQLVSVSLYGSAARGEYAAGHSNIDVVIVLADTSIDSLLKISKFINKRKFALVNPLFLTEYYIKRSTDVFPIEFSDMKDNHVVLCGKDVLKDMAIDTKNLRFQCEHEIKSKIINIKRAYIRTIDVRMLKNLLFKSTTSSLHIMRNLLKLKGTAASYAKGDVVDGISKEFGIDLTPVNKILDAKNRNLKLEREEIRRLFNCLVGILETISDEVDKL